MNSKGQLTIFIILGIALLIVLVVLFSDRNFVSIFIPKTPVGQIEDCMLDSLGEGVEIIGKQGGSISPENYYLYKDDKIEYICYAEENYEGCVNQKPLLRESVEKELEEYVRPKIVECVKEVESITEGMSYKDPEVDVDVVLGDVILDVKLDLKIENGENTEFYKNIKIDVNSKLYEFVIVAMRLVNIEAEYGDAHVDGYMFQDKNLKVEKIKQGDGSTLYILNNRNKEEKFQFAVRSHVVPPGKIEIEKFR